MVEQIHLYTAKICPYAQRVEIAIAEAGAEDNVISYQIDLQNKPEWYAPKVNPSSKVPAIAYGGPKVKPEEPSSDSIKLAESLVLLEFIADLYPNSGLLPKDPVLRAKVRFFIDVVSTKFSPGWASFALRGESADALYQGIEAIQNLIAGKFAVGDSYTNADAAIAPFIGRLFVAVENDLGKYAPGEGLKVYQTLQTEKFAKFREYYKNISQRPSFVKTFDKEFIAAAFRKRLGRAQ